MVKVGVKVQNLFRSLCSRFSSPHTISSAPRPLPAIGVSYNFHEDQLISMAGFYGFVEIKAHFSEQIRKSNNSSSRTNAESFFPFAS
jgi:hypothetical protein